MIAGMAGDFSIVSLMNLEACHGCAGKGAVGRLGEWNIVCEHCGGNGRIFRERAALIREEGEEASP